MSYSPFHPLFTHYSPNQKAWYGVGYGLWVKRVNRSVCLSELEEINSPEGNYYSLASSLGDTYSPFSPKRADRLPALRLGWVKSSGNPPRKGEILAADKRQHLPSFTLSHIVDSRGAGRGR